MVVDSKTFTQVFFAMHFEEYYRRMNNESNITNPEMVILLIIDANQTVNIETTAPPPPNLLSLFEEKADAEPTKVIVVFYFNGTTAQEYTLFLTGIVTNETATAMLISFFATQDPPITIYSLKAVEEITTTVAPTPEPEATMSVGVIIAIVIACLVFVIIIGCVIKTRMASTEEGEAKYTELGRDKA